jgi:hypothetical protein
MNAIRTDSFGGSNDTPIMLLAASCPSCAPSFVPPNPANAAAEKARKTSRLGNLPSL